MRMRPYCPTDRRRLLTGAAASLALWSLLPRAASAAGTRDPRLLVVILRGGLDGLAAVAPVGDPAYAQLRGEIALRAIGEGAALPLDPMFALNAAMPGLHALYRKSQALIVHATHTPYRERSHFDGQDVLESGRETVGRNDDGWLNRALQGLPTAGRADPKGLAIGPTVPLLMRGAAPALSWIPKVASLPLRESTIQRLTDLYAATDPILARAFADGASMAQVADATPTPSGQPRPHREFIEPAQAAARFLSAADGPRIGVLSYNGWDTHANEGPANGQLANRLAALDAALAALQAGMGTAWQETAVLVITEFGRTARVNGTAGTDHGMATVALLLGGAVKGGRVLADWPGLGASALYEARDLKPTTDLRTVLKGVLRDHLGIPDAVLDRSVFPSARPLRPMQDLFA